jgi:hypothetical protein
MLAPACRQAGASESAGNRVTSKPKQVNPIRNLSLFSNLLSLCEFSNGVNGIIACRRAGGAAAKKGKTCVIFLKNIETLFFYLTGKWIVWYK